MSDLSQNIYWVDTAHRHTVIAENLAHSQHQVDCFDDPSPWLERLSAADKCSIAIVSDDQSQRALELIKKSKAFNLPTFWCVANPSKADRQAFYELGGDELLCGDLSENELPIIVSRYQHRVRQEWRIKSELDEASSMALLAMDNSSDLGGILSFVKEALYEREYEALAQSIFKYVNTFSQSALIEMQGSSGVKYYTSEAEVSAESKSLLKQNQSAGRIVQHKDIIQINRENITILASGLPEHNPDRIGRISDNMAIFADISDRFVVSVSLEEQLKTSETKKQAFLDTLGHELKTPLNAIIGLSKLISKKEQDESLGASGQKATKSIYSSAKRVNRIISTLMDISQVSSNQQNLNPQLFCIASVIQSAISELEERTTKNRNKISLTCPPSLELYSEPSHIEKMVYQLLDNANKFTADGAITIDVTVEENTALDLIKITISDTGCGIDAESGKTLFDSIGQLDQSHEREHYGVGLGLFYVGVMSKFLGGHIDFSSELDKGSQFHLVLPSLADKPSVDSDEENDIDCELF